MTYNEIKRRLIKCEKTLALFQSKDLSNATPEERQQAQKNIISVNESIVKYKKILKEGSKTYILTPKSGQTSAASLSDDEVDALKDADDIKGIKSADGEEIKERLKKNSGVEFSVDETKSIAKQVGKAVAMSLKAVGDAVRTMRATHIEENSFDVEVDYKNGSDDAFSFHIIDDTLHLADFSFDKELVDVGVKPSGEAIVNVDVLSNELQKHFKSLTEKLSYNGREFSHEEEDRLDLIAHREFKNDFSKLSDEDKAKVFASRSKVGVEESDVKESYTKEKLLAYLGQADDAMIRTYDDKYLIIYNPKNGNDDNAAMWHDDTVFGVDQDGGEHEVRYDQIDGFQLEGYDPDQEQKDDEEDHGVGYDDEGRPLGEGEGDDHHYLKVPSADYKKAAQILDQNIDPTYVKMEVVDNDGAGNVIFYFIFKHEDGFDDMYDDSGDQDSEFYQEPEEDGGAFVYDAAMDLRANDITVVDSSADMDEATDLNDPVLMKMRVAKKRNADLKKVDQMHARDRKDQRINGKKRLLIKQLKDKRAEIEREMENDPEIETTGGPVADRYGDMLNKIDNAIEKAAGRIKPVDYDTAVGKVNEGDGQLVTFGYDLDMIQQVVDHLKNKYTEGDDYELHIGRGDDLPNAVTLKNPALEKDYDLNDMLNAAQDDQDRYDAYTDGEDTDYAKRRKEGDDYYEDPDYYKESTQHPSKGHRGGAKKIQKAYDLVVTMMKDLAKKYKAGDKSVVDQLKTLTITKKKLEKQLDQAVAGTNIGQDIDEKKINEYASRDLDEIFGALGYRQGFDEFIEDNPGCVEVIMEWIGSISEFRQKLSNEYSKEEQENLGFYYGDDDDDDYNESLDESLNPEVSKKVAQFIKAMAKRYGYKEQDAVYAIMAALKQRDFDGVNEFDDKSMKAYGDAVKTAYKGKHQGTNYQWPMSQATKDRKEADKKQPLKEFTDNSFKGSEVIDDANERGPDMFGKGIFADLLPKGVASENDAVEALKAHDKSPIKARMGRYAPMFVHVQYHELEHEGKDYRMHQTQYYNSNFKDKDPNFNPGVSKITLFQIDKKAADRRDKEETTNLGTIIVKTDEYVQDLRNLPGLGKRHMEESVKVGDTLTKDGKKGKVVKVMDDMANVDFGNGDVYGITFSRIKGSKIVKEASRKDLGMSSSVSKRRAKAELNKPGKDGSKVYGLDKDGKRVHIKSINDVDKFKKFELDADINEGKGGQIMPGDYVKNQHGNIYKRVDGKVGRHDAYVRVTNGKVGKKKTGLHDSFKLTLVKKDEIEEAGPGFKHDCAAKVIHKEHGEGICIPEKHTLVKEGNKHVVTHYDVLFKEGKKVVEDIPVSELDIKTTNEHWHKGYKKKKK